MIRKGRKQQNALATLLCRGWRGKNIFLGTKIYFPRHVLIFSSGGFSYIASLSSLFPKQIFLQAMLGGHATNLPSQHCSLKIAQAFLLLLLIDMDKSSRSGGFLSLGDNKFQEFPYHGVLALTCRNEIEISGRGRRLLKCL